MRALSLSPADIARRPADDLVGAVLLRAVPLPGRTLPKGTRLDPDQVALLLDATADLAGAVALGWLDPDDVHEDEAAWRLARAVAGAGVVVGVPAESRVELTAERAGVLHVNVEPLARLNRIDPIEVVTRYDGSAVRGGEVVGAVKVAPTVVPAAVVRKGEAFATGQARLVRVAPFLPLEVAAIVADPGDAAEAARFEAALRARVSALGGRVSEVATLPADPPAATGAAAHRALELLVLQRRTPVVVVAGVAAGDPLSPVLAALDALGGQVLRRGAPAHPGSMVWLAELSGARILGLPRCTMLDHATSADLILPRLLTGEALTAESLAELGHGGLLDVAGRDRLPAHLRPGGGAA